MHPDFLIIGAEKAGTTWLHDVLRTHPGLFMTDVKEVHYFNRFDSNGNEIDNFTRRGPDWYARHFTDAPAGLPRGEATPMYLCDPDAAGRIKDTLPEARFIVMLREPVSRAWSHYRMARAKEHITADLDALIAAEDPLVLGRGRYGEQLARWFTLFDRDRFLILVFEEVMADPGPALTRVADWLGVDPAPLLAANPEESRNAASGYKSAALYNASVRGARALRNFPLTRGLAGWLKASGLYDKVKSANRSAPPEMTLSDAQRAALAAFYARDRAALHGLLAEVPGIGTLPWPDAPPVAETRPDRAAGARVPQ
jgi:hypothetical protein